MSKSQNIYDNQDFFDGYKKLRENLYSCNNTEEKPALFSLFPDLDGKSVLDLGCGFGENCAEFQRLKASHVTGVDISEKMLDVARSEHPDIEFIRGDISDLSFIKDKYDVVFSSLAVHYIEDFDCFCKDVFALLNHDGYFVFSQEHPINTCGMSGGGFTKDKDGHILYYNLDSYMVSGKRTTSWIVDDVVKYHRTVSEVVNALASAGFVITKMLEPMPDEKLEKDDPAQEIKMEKRRHKPIFLLIKAWRA